MLPKSSIIASLVIVSLISGSAQAQTEPDPNAAAGGALLTTTSGLTTTSVGIGILIYFLTKKDDSNKKDAAKAAEYYLRQNSLQLAQELSSGKGAVLGELASAMHVSADNEPAFRELMRKNRSELLALANTKQLSPDRAVQFIKHMVGLMESHAGLRSDLQRWSAGPQTN